MKTLQKFFSLLMAALLIALGFTSVSVNADDIDEVNEIIASIPSDWPEAPVINAQTAILMDADSGEILYAKNATKTMYPASTTKLMTALLTLENASLTDIVDFSYTAVSIPSGSSHIGMRRSEQMVLKECLYGLLLPSANEVANALAEHVSGSIRSFVVRMNERAFQLGAVNTIFQNVNGLHEDGHYTCAYDLALIMKACIANNVLVEISGTQSYVHHADELLNKDIPMTNTHMMLRKSSEYYNEYVLCGKTGHTAESGYNLVSYAEKDGVRLIVVVMGCENGQQYTSTQSLLDYGFNYFHRVLPAELDSSLDMDSLYTSSPLQLPTANVSLLSLNASESLLLPVNVTFDMLERTVETTDSGIEITYTYSDYPLGSIHLSYEGGSDSSPMYQDTENEKIQVPEVGNLVTIDGWLMVLLSAILIVFIGLCALMKHLTFPKYKRR